MGIATLVISLLILDPFTSSSLTVYDISLSSESYYEKKLPQLLGIMVAGKADVYSIRDWLLRHNRLFDKLVIVDGSKNDYSYIERASQPYANVIILKEKNLNLTTVTDQTVRKPAMSVLGNPVGSWIMICHADEFWTIDPRRVAMENDLEEKRKGWLSSGKAHNILRFRVLTASPYESAYEREVEKMTGNPDYWQEGHFHILEASNMTHGPKSTSPLLRSYFENRLIKWQDGMAWGTRHSSVVPEHIPRGQTIRVYRDAFFVHFKLHDFSPGAVSGHRFTNSNLKTGPRDEIAEGWIGKFLDVSHPEQVAQFPPQSVKSVIPVVCNKEGNKRWPCELEWKVDASFE